MLILRVLKQKFALIDANLDGEDSDCRFDFLIQIVIYSADKQLYHKHERVVQVWKIDQVTNQLILLSYKRPGNFALWSHVILSE